MGVSGSGAVAAYPAQLDARWRSHSPDRGVVERAWGKSGMGQADLPAGFRLAAGYFLP